jgi:hypothetical protein
MDYEVPFDSIASAHEFVNLLVQVVLETRHDLEADIQREISASFSRRLEALQITAYKLQTLEFHLKKSRCLLNDLRSLRRLLVGKLADGEAAVRPKSMGIAKAAASSSIPSSKVSRPEDDLALLGLTG